MRWDVIIAGFGGQGILSAGQMLAYAGMVDGLNVTYFPSYGGEVRGGTANCSVVLSKRRIASPVVARPHSIIVLNAPSLVRFMPAVQPQGHIFVNSSLIAAKVDRTDVEPHYLAANDIARDLGDERMATLVLVGAYIGVTQAVSVGSMNEALAYFFSGGKESLATLNEKAVAAGASAASG
jgi:2-oxoglutarate ferredoxin oxidoreductase subunit gamma